MVALFASRLGAAQVIAVEVDDVIEVARQTAAANGMGDRITFVQARSTELSLPQPADVLTGQPESIYGNAFFPLLHPWRFGRRPDAAEIAREANGGRLRLVVEQHV